MYVFNVAFAFVLLCGSGFALPNVGRCSFMRYFCNARRCTTVFYKDLQKDPSAKCSVKFQTMVDCVRQVVNDCVKGILSQSQVNSILNRNFKESASCLEGPFQAPENSPGVTLPCTSTYLQKAPLCGKSFHQKFVANRADPTLCSEQAKAKKCVKDLLASECTFGSQSKELLNLALADYNPFCADNRDPGATGNDQCYLYLPRPNPTVRQPQSQSVTTVTYKVTRKNKSDVISVKHLTLLFLLGLYLVLV